MKMEIVRNCETYHRRTLSPPTANFHARFQLDAFAFPTPLNMPINVHALVQDAHDPNAFVLWYVKHDVRLIFVPPQTRREFACTATMQRVFRKSVESLLQTRKILPRLVQSEIENRVFMDSIEIVSGFRGKTIGGHSISI